MGLRWRVEYTVGVQFVGVQQQPCGKCFVASKTHEQGVEAWC